MSTCIKTAVALLALTIPLSASYAKTVKISGTHTRSEINAKCTAQGGVAYNTKGKSGKFGCDNLNKGTSIDCNANGKCTGTVPQ